MPLPIGRCSERLLNGYIPILLAEGDGWREAADATADDDTRAILLFSPLPGS
jgi:hypothetical protein